MSHFLKPLVIEPGAPCILRNERTGLALATTIEAAFDSRSRRRGLLGRDALAPGAGIIIAPCGGIHTLYMRFPIDVVFVNKDGTVRKVCRGVKPWRLALSVLAFAAVEVASGEASRSGTLPGDRLALLMGQSSLR